MNPEIEQLKKEIEDLKNKFKAIEASATIPKPVEDAFRERLRLEVISSIMTSSKSSSSEGQSVNEAGASSYSVLKNPDAYLQVNISGTVYYLPVFT